MRIFIASSGERLNMAIEVGSWLEGMNVEPVLWNEPEVFPLGAYTWDALIDLSENVDAAIFIFGEDDQIWFRGESTMTVRDNVLLEYGLFSGKLSKANTIFLCDGRPKLASDLEGITWGDIRKKNSVRIKLENWINSIRASNQKKVKGFKITDLNDAFQIALKNQKTEKLRIFAISTFKSVQMLRLINDISINHAEIMLREYDNKNDEYYDQSMEGAIDNAILNWKHMLENDHKIKELDIFRFNYHPDEGYYIFDDKYLILGNLKYEMDKKEYTFSKNVMLIDNQTETGRTWIKEYITRFEDTKKNYETSVINSVIIQMEMMPKNSAILSLLQLFNLEELISITIQNTRRKGYKQKYMAMRDLERRYVAVLNDKRGDITNRDVMSTTVIRKNNLEEEDR